MLFPGSEFSTDFMDYAFNPPASYANGLFVDMLTFRTNRQSDFERCTG